jgi:hypothetical protein
MSKLIMNAPGLYDMQQPYWRERYVGDPNIQPGMSGYASHWGPPQGVFKHSNRGFGLPEISQAQMDCIVEGGNWNGTTGICSPPTPTQQAYRTAMQVARVASVGAGAYHGYKRNNSIGWAIWWALMGGLFPVITPAIAVAQGFGKPAKR